MSSAFARFWQTDLTREAFLDCVTRDDLCALRLVSHDFADLVATQLFQSIQVNFNINSFSRRFRMLALDRIGHHVKNFHFNLPHSEDTFLPPLIDPETYAEVSFQYDPQPPQASRPSSSSSESSSCKYGSWEINDLLVRQYPPLFHAATNVTSFTRALAAMPFLRTLTISCPDQPAGQRYRRSAVDYALISLRLAVEAANPPFLDTLSLDPIHPSAVFYLRPHQGIGTGPASTRVWNRIQHLDIKMVNFVTPDEEDSTDHLKIMHTYLNHFRNMHTLAFTWLGKPGPCPLSLDAEPCTSRPSSLGPVTSTIPACRPMKFRRLRSMKLENAILDASQVSRFIMKHRKVLQDIDYAACTLRSGTWDDALAPLSRISGNDDWRTSQGSSLSASSGSGSQSQSQSQCSEVMDVPIVYSPVEEPGNPMECVRELLWDQDDKDLMRSVNKVAADVFKHVSSRHRRRRRGGVLACGIKSLLKGLSARWP